MSAEIGGRQLSSLLESLPGIASVLRSPVADAMVSMIRAGAGLSDFNESDAKELVQYATRRGLMGAEEGADLLEEVKRRPKGASRKPVAKVRTPPKSKPDVAAKPADVERVRVAKSAVPKPPKRTAPPKPTTSKPAKPKVTEKAPAKRKATGQKTTGKKPAKKAPAKKAAGKKTTAKRTPAKKAPAKKSAAKPVKKKVAKKKSKRSR